MTATKNTMTTTQAKKLGFQPYEKREQIGTRMGGLNNRIEIAIIRATWEIRKDGKAVIAGAKTRKEALTQLAKKLAIA